MHILHVVGARPNFMKVAPVMGALKPYPKIKQTLIHTWQHYDTNMSDIFFQRLEIPAPDVNLGVGSGSRARQTAEIVTRFEPIVLERKPDLVLVYGAVNSTVAAALVCSKLLIQATWRLGCAPETGQCWKKLIGWSRTSWPICCLSILG
jgi:UDP-N-acetylglucosamine 2-epimerase (non-hydrolysing)